MARKGPNKQPARQNGAARVNSPVEELLLAAQERGDESLETGRYLVTFKEGAAEEGLQSLGGGGKGMRVADSRDFDDQAATIESVGDADALVFAEVGVALVGGAAAAERGMATAEAEIAADSPIESIDPETFVFANEEPPRRYQQRTYDPAGNLGAGRVGTLGNGGTATAPETTTAEYLRGFARAANAIAGDLTETEAPTLEAEEEVLVAGNTWGLIRCRVPTSPRSGVGIRVAVLDTGFDLGHPDFVGRAFITSTFVGQPVQDLHGHGTHTAGTATGPKAPAGTTPRYGIAYRAPIVIGKVLANSGVSVGASVIAGMNWAIALRCPVISMSLGAQTGVQPAYTAAGAAALARGLLIIAAAGNSAAATGAPANSPTIFSVASLDPTLVPSSFSNFGKVEITGPGRDVFSSFPRPRRYAVLSGTSMATPHVAGCAALWAETSAALRGMLLWRRLQATARHLPFPTSRVGAGLVQAPQV